jgi:hypothetical protein
VCNVICYICIRGRTRVPRTGGNRAGSTGSRSYRSGPVRNMTGNRSLTGPKEPGQTEPSGVPAGLPGFPVGFFEPCKPDRVRLGEPWAGRNGTRSARSGEARYTYVGEKACYINRTGTAAAHQPYGYTHTLDDGATPNRNPLMKIKISSFFCLFL